MFGLEAKLIAIGGAILGFLALIFGAFLKGKSSARKEGELDTLRATRDAQVKVGEAQAKDTELDAEARKKVEEAKKIPGGGAKPGGTYEL